MMPNDRKNIQFDFRDKFLSACNKFLQQTNSAEAQLEIKKVKKRYMSMIEDALSQVTRRIPTGRDT
jgi:hypothetical protein